jgi:hypothetical protein
MCKHGKWIRKLRKGCVNLRKDYANMRKACLNMGNGYVNSGRDVQTWEMDV